MTYEEVRQDPRYRHIYDDPEVIAAIEYTRKHPAVDCHTEVRRELQHEVVRELYGRGDVYHRREAILLIGPPGAGKSSYVGQKLRSKGYLLIDADEAKPKFPEFYRGYGASVVHADSKIVVGVLSELAVATSCNLVWPLIGKDENRLGETIETLRRCDYRVRLVLLYISAEEAVKRAFTRFKFGQGTDRRFIDPAYVLVDVDDKPREVFRRLRDSGLNLDPNDPRRCDSYEAFDASDPQSLRKMTV